MAPQVQSPTKCEVRPVIRFLYAKVYIQGKFTNSQIPDFAPGDYHLFLHLKKHLAGKKFDENNDVQEAMTWFKVLAADVYESGIPTLVRRLGKCLDNAGEYFEK